MLITHLELMHVQYVLFYIKHLMREHDFFRIILEPIILHNL